MAETEGGMIERIARYLAGPNPDGVTDWTVTQGDKVCIALGPRWKNPLNIDRAKAILQLMLEPTEGMIDHACPVPDNSGTPYVYDRAITAELYTACIEAAAAGQ